MGKFRARTGWTVYILRCADGSLYTGVTRDVERRIGEHNSSGRLAARYTRARRPVVLVYQEEVRTRSAACRREYSIKQLPRREKLALINGGARGAKLALCRSAGQTHEGSRTAVLGRDPKGRT